jgi:integrase
VLSRQRISVPSQRIYKRVLHHFLTWWRRGRWDPPSSLAEIDAIAEVYVEWLCSSGAPLYHATHLGAALCLYEPWLKGRLPRLQMAVSGLRRQRMVKSWLPIPLDLLQAAAIVLWRWGESQAAIALLLSFDCYLRISEVVGLQCSLLILPGDRVLGRQGSSPSLTLLQAKTGRDQSVHITEPLVIFLLKRQRAKARAMRQSRLLYSLSERRLRFLFHKALYALGIPVGVYVFHSIRHGGSCYDFHFDILSVSGVMERGRWTSLKTCRIYLTRGRSAMLDGSLPLGNQLLISALLSIPMSFWFNADVHLPPLRFR